MINFVPINQEFGQSTFRKMMFSADRRKILQSLVDYHRENYAEMTKSDMRLFLHMLYRQAYSPSRYEDLQFMKKVVSEEEEMYRDQSGLLTLLKVLFTRLL